MVNKVKIWIAAGTALCITALVGIVGFQHEALVRAEEQLEIKANNYNALENEYNNIRSENIEYKTTLYQLETSVDSINVMLNKARKELKVKDNEIKRLGYIASVATRTDTIFVKDTIFKENVQLDTTITDGEWYKMRLYVKYPNIISVTPEFKSEKIVVTKAKKVILNPKKCRIARWFQKKSTVIETEVVENNPYISKTKERFLEVIE